MGTGSDDLPIVDAHQHFWDLSLGKHPWLRDEPPPPFRYGDTRPLHGEVIAADELWACTTCMACVEECPAHIDIVDTIVDLDAR